MIHLDKDGFPVDKNGDGGDSSMRAGMLSIFCKDPSLIYYWNKLSKYEKFEGHLCRHPTQNPWNNPWNFSRDQLIPLMAGLFTQKQTAIARRVLWAHIRRLLFCQNFERDYPGSKKYPWKHSFINDKGENETRKFDFADPLGPSHFWHLIICARAWYFYPLGFIGSRRLLATIALHGRSSHREHNQIIAQIKVAGPIFIKAFKAAVPKWKEDLREYWGSRDEIEYAEFIIADLERY